MKWFLTLVVVGLSYSTVQAGPIINFFRALRGDYNRTETVTYGYAVTQAPTACCCDEGGASTMTPAVQVSEVSPIPATLEVGPLLEWNQLERARLEREQRYLEQQPVTIQVSPLIERNRFERARLERERQHFEQHRSGGSNSNLPRKMPKVIDQK